MPSMFVLLPHCFCICFSMYTLFESGGSGSFPFNIASRVLGILFLEEMALTLILPFVLTIIISDMLNLSNSSKSMGINDKNKKVLLAKKAIIDNYKKHPFLVPPIQTL